MDKLCAWRPKNVGKELQRLNTYGKSRKWLEYNEFVVPSLWWSEHMPDVIEAIIGDAQVHAAFLRSYRLTADTHPLVYIDLNGTAPRSPDPMEHSHARAARKHRYHTPCDGH